MTPGRKNSRDPRPANGRAGQRRNGNGHKPGLFDNDLDWLADPLDVDGPKGNARMDAALEEQLDALDLKRPPEVSEAQWQAARRRAAAELRRARMHGRFITPANLRRLVMRQARSDKSQDA